MINRDAAIEIARNRAAEKGWSFAEPVVEAVHRRSWLGASERFDIATHCGKLGTKARFVVDAATGEVTAEGYIPR
ncbi:MAG: hypothetical protein ABIW85_01255 [Variovorax sp.]